VFDESLLREQDVGPLGKAVLTVLERVGAQYQNHEILSALSSAGAKVDTSGELATFPREMTLEFVGGLQTEAADGRKPGGSARAFVAPLPGWFFHQLSPYVYDSARGERRPGNRPDYVELIKLCDVLHPENGVGHCLLLADVPAPVEPLEAMLLQFEYAHRPRGAYVQDVRQVEYLAEMGEIAGIEDLAWLANVAFSSPLRLGRDVADILVHKVKHGGPANLYIMTVSGAGTPVTVAGCTVVAAAEFLANWMAARALNPDVEISGGAWIATMDMGCMEASYSAPDAMVRNLALREFLRRWTGVTIGVGGGEYCPARVPGVHAALEKAYSAMTVAAFTGYHPGVGSGHLDGGLSVSAEQLLLDREMAAALRHLEGPIEVNADTIGLADILTVGHASAGNYMGADHTVRHFRSSLWHPELAERSGWTGRGSEARALERARRKVAELTALYHKPEVDEEKLSRLRRVVERARRRISETRYQ